MRALTRIEAAFLPSMCAIARGTACLSKPQASAACAASDA